MVHVERALPMFLDVGLGFRVASKRTRLVTAQVEVFRVRHQLQNIIDHSLDQLTRTRRQRRERTAPRTE